MRNLFHAAGFIVIRASYAAAELLLSREFFTLHPHLIRRFGCPSHELGIRAVLRIVFVEDGPARHPGLGCELFKRRADHGQRADHVLAHPTHDDSGLVRHL